MVSLLLTPPPVAPLSSRKTSYMPWTPRQHRLFEAAKNDPEIAKENGISQADAARMAGEGIKKPSRLSKLYKNGDK